MNYERNVCEKMTSCKECNKKFNTPWSFCCLFVCHEYEFCRDCNEGIYGENFKRYINENRDYRSMEL